MKTDDIILLSWLVVGVVLPFAALFIEDNPWRDRK